MALECLKDLIGITRSNCDCITGDMGSEPEADWYKNSVSGLYLDELPGIVSIKGVDQSTDCVGELATFYQQSIESAKTDIRDDFITGLTARYRQANKTYIGRAGGVTFTANEALGKAYAGLHIRNEWIRGGKIKIKSIYYQFAVPPTEIKLYRRTMRTNLVEYVKDLATGLVINPNASHEIALTTPEELDMDGYEYILLYDAAGIVPKNNSTSCGCGRSEHDLHRYIHLSGIETDVLDDFSFMKTFDKAKGLALNLEVGCTASGILCELYYSDMAYQAVIAHALRFRAGYYVQEKVLNSSEINQYTMSNREYLWGKRNHFVKEYQDRINWMVESVALGTFTDCYVCNTDQKKINKSGLLV